jgi:hypothetical protein
VRELDADGDEVVPSETSVSSLDERSGLTEDDIQFTARRKGQPSSCPHSFLCA